ncbi:hypothetical protein GCM10014713_68680 [Streptomyces purpureus]|uniref:Uncharacterized protein n=1 Tax=Streptomyces purpureus TaxID=1951 RepID=A0A918HI62_9ACTN|nr:hypothetical protein GCM10014713_68680 [Streptomyces purpureus]
MMARLICQVCGLSTEEEAAAEGGTLFLVGAGEESGFRGPIEDGERTLHPPVHLACGWESVRHCQHLLDGYEAARVARPVSWGLYGILHAWYGGAFVPVDARAQIAHGDPSLALLLPGQAVMELNDVRPGPGPAPRPPRNPRLGPGPRPRRRPRPPRRTGPPGPRPPRRPYAPRGRPRPRICMRPQQSPEVD